MHISSSCFFSSFLLQEEKRTFTYAQGATLDESIRNPCPLQHKAETPPTRTAILHPTKPPRTFRDPRPSLFAQYIFLLFTRGIPPVQHSSCPTERSTVAQHLAGLRETTGPVRDVLSASQRRGWGAVRGRRSNQLTFEHFHSVSIRDRDKLFRL